MRVWLLQYYLNVANGVKYYSKKEVIRATESNGVIVTPQKEDGDGVIVTPQKEDGDGVIVTPQKENGDENALSIDNKVEDHGVIVTPQKENGDENALSIDNKVSFHNTVLIYIIRAYSIVFKTETIFYFL